MSSPGQAPSAHDDVHVGAEREVVVGKVAHGGHMVARWGDLVVFVRHGIPGERVRARITEVRPRYARADVIEVLEADPRRRVSPCPVAGSCGGCDFQHMPEDVQRAMKLDVLREALVHQGRLSESHVNGLLDGGIVDLGRDLHWRSRMRYRTMPDVDGRTTLALHRHRSEQLVDASACVIADRAGHRAAVELAVDSAPGADVYMAVGDGGAVVSTRPDSTGVVHHPVHVDDEEFEFGVPIDGFWQVHPGLVPQLLQTVLDWGEPAIGETWWDLYAGVGPIAAALAVRVGPTGSVQAVESAAVAVREGERCLQQMPWVRWHRSDVRRFVHRRDARGSRSRPDGVVLDPPRSGAGAQIVDAVCDMAPRAVIVIACDPVALGRDTTSFERCGYRLIAVRAFDAFPQTHHLETVALYEPTDRIS